MIGSGYFNSCKLFQLSEIVAIVGIANALQFGFRFYQWINAVSGEEQIVEIRTGKFQGHEDEILISFNYDFAGLMVDCLWYVMMIFCSGSIIVATNLKSRLLLFPYMIPVSYNIVCAVKALVNRSNGAKVPDPIIGPEIPCPVYFLIIIIDLVLMIWSIWIVVMYYNELLNEDFRKWYDEEMDAAEEEKEKDAFDEESNGKKKLKNFRSMPDLTSSLGDPALQN